MPAGVTHPVRGLQDVSGHAVEAEQDVAHQDQQGVADEGDLGRQEADAGEWDKEGEQGEARDRVQDPRGADDRGGERAPPSDDQRQHEGDEEADRDRSRGHAKVLSEPLADDIQVLDDPVRPNERLTRGHRSSPAAGRSAAPR